ncbi:MAG: hypothetical protein II965_05555 [Pyramidobacter sp.]|nr:hypothetical protein [Pyramidobacter sp.]MBP3752246.1 hypothetical protein [Pyramidobacter sp.]MBP3837031.1 hypothetical protein [Pyramidobacter sp.]MBQ4490697.1 hypothetical protein [Pyramidobacter sp.]MBQ8090439.1 hypothetical protein [Pyramidobacter sp.]
MKNYVDLMCVDSEILTPEEYIKLYNTNRANIKQSEIVPPRLGDSHISGGIRVTYHSPFYKFADGAR